MNKYALELNNITKVYKDGESDNTVLSGVSLKVENNELVAIVGPSGSGKSTLLSIAGALLSPTHGTVAIGETALEQLKPSGWTKVRRQQVGFIFQSFQLIPFLNVQEQLEYILKLNNENTKARRMDATQLLTELGLGNRLKAYPNQLSGGEKQRVAIARSLVNKPDVILADEPTANLDSERGFQVVELIREETKKRNNAAVIVTHDERILDLVDTIYRIENGVITLDTSRNNK